MTRLAVAGECPDTLATLSTPQTRLMPLTEARAPLIFQYYKENLNHLFKWDAVANPSAHSIETWLHYAQWAKQEYLDQKQVEFIATDHSETEMLALCSITDIKLAPYYSGDMGFSIAEKHEGKGIMFEVAQKAVEFMFKEYGLHRLTATFHPDNLRSKALLERLGFEREGYAKAYMQVGDMGWQDHVVMALVNPDHT